MRINNQLQAELAKAERREKLESDLVGKYADHDGVHVSSADPGSSALVTYLAALGLTVPAEIVGQWLTLVPVLALEIGSAMAVVLVGAIPLPQLPAAQATLAKVVLPRGPRPQKTTKAQEQAAQRIVDRLKSEGGSTTSTERGLAESLGTSRPTVRRALNGLVLAGLVGLEATRQGTALRLIS